MNKIGIIFVIIFLFVALLVVLFGGFAKEKVYYEDMVIDEEQSKEITKTRVSLVESITDTFIDAWRVPAEYLEDETALNTNIVLLPNNITTVTMAYLNNLIRMYYNWETSIVEIDIISRYTKKSIRRRKKFSFKKQASLEDIYLFFEKHRPAEEKISTEEKVATVQAIMAEKLAPIIEEIVDKKIAEKRP